MARTSILAAMILAFIFAPLPARAQETVTPIDLGLLRDSEIAVVQKLLYSMAGRTEVGMQMGLMPFDPYTTALLGNMTISRHFSELLGAELALAGGYGMKNGHYRELEGPTYGVAPEAYRFLGRMVGSVEWTPVYAKMNWLGRKVFHHNVFLLGGAGATLEQSVLPAADLAFCPTLTWGLGARIFGGSRTSLRLEIRDDVMLQHRSQTDTNAIKQNVMLLIGLSRLGGAS